jgi:hypothetical protein
MDNKVDIHPVIIVLAVLLTVGIVSGHSVNNQRLTDVLDPTADQDAATKKYVDDQVIAAGGSSKEQTQDWAWDIGGGTQTLITVTFQDATNDVDFVVDEASIDHDALTNFAATEHFLMANITEVGTLTSGVWNGTAIGMPYGGTGAASFTDGGILLGSGANPITAMSVLTDGEVIVGDGTTDPVTLAAFTSSTGTLQHEYGGLEADVTAYSEGLYGMIAGSTVDIDTSAELASAIGDETGSGAVVFGTSPTISTSINLPSDAVDAAGEISVDLIAPTHFTHSQDWGDVSTDASGSVALDNDVVGADEIADGDYGDFTFSGGVASLDSDTVSLSEIVDADYGDFTITSNIATLDADTVSDNEIDYDAVTLADFTDDLGEDPGHTHTGATISGIDVSDDLNLSAGTHITLSDDTLNVDDAFLLNATNDTMAGILTSDGITITAGNALTLGVVRWDDGSERIDGEQISDDTIDEDSIDFTDITLADFTDDLGTNPGHTHTNIGEDSIDFTSITLADFTDDLGEDPGHTHTTTSVSGIDISDDTNLSGGTNITLSGDTLNVDDAFLVNDDDDTMTGELTTDGLNVTTGNSLIFGITQWDNGSDLIDGEQIANDTIDDDSIDFSDVTLADFTDDLGEDSGHTHTVATLPGLMLDAGTPADNTLVRFDGTDGVTTQTSGIVVDDSDNMSGIGTLTTTDQFIAPHGIASPQYSFSENTTDGMRWITPGVNQGVNMYYSNTRIGAFDTSGLTIADNLDVILGGTGEFTSGSGGFILPVSGVKEDVGGTLEIWNANEQISFLDAEGGNAISIIAGGYTIGSAAINESELETIDGVSAGTVSASKAVVVDGSKNIATLGTIGCGAITSTGNSNFDTDTIYVDSTNHRVGIETTTPLTQLDVGGVICARSTAFDVPDAGAKGIFMKYNSAVTYGSIWCYDYGVANEYLGLELDADFLEFQISGVKKGEITAAGIFDFGEIADIQTTDTTSINRIGKSQLGINGGDYATFGYRGHGVTNYAIFQGSDYATYFKSAAGKGIYLYPENTLTATFTSTSTELVGTFTIGAAALAEAELETIDDVSAGTVSASKAVVVDADKKIDQLTFTDFIKAGGVANYTIIAGTDGDIDQAGTAVARLNQLILDTNLEVDQGGTGRGSVTANTLLYGAGTSSIQELGPLTDGQLIIGDSSDPPVAAALTEGDAIQVTNGAGSITIRSGAGFSKYVNTTVGTVNLEVANSGTVYNNNGMTNDITYNLPSASDGADIVYTFLMRDPGNGSDEILLAPEAGDYVYAEGTLTPLEGYGIKEANSYASEITIISDGANGWWEINHRGTWAYYDANP